MSAACMLNRWLWIDPQGELLPEQRSQLLAAGVEPLPLMRGTAPGMALQSSQGVVLRLDGTEAAGLQEVQSLFADWQVRLPVICRVPRPSLEVAVAALRQGAAHVLADDDWRPQSWAAALELVAPRALQEEFVFVDPQSRKLLELARRVAQAEVTALLTGPTGAGKEVLARILHEASARHARPFVALNCAALPESMIEDLLFGHEKGAFTGALREHAGVFEQAHGGSLFLDEIGEMPQGLQARLLRVLQEREVTRLGGRHAMPVDVRLIAATNKDLRKAVQAGEFREDLYFRISTFCLRIAPLRERSLDIVPLARLMLQRHARPGQHWHLTEQACALLQAHGWPGNVRELGNVMQRAMVLAHGVIDTAHLVFDDWPAGVDVAAGEAGMGSAGAPSVLPHPADELAGGVPLGLDASLRSSEHRVIAAALRAATNRTEAARVLGISPRTLRYKLAQMRAQGIPLTSNEAS